MAFISADRVKETTITTGTGAITLAGASAGFRSFASVMSAADTCHYCIVGNNEWEVGLGTYNTTLARTTVLASSNSNNAVNFSAGTKDIFITIAALSISELTGGTTGQVLKKTSNADFAFEWAADSTSVAWGAITGTLSAQTDLQTALNAKLTAASNLSDLGSASTARTNLGLGTAAVLSTADVDERALDAVGAGLVSGAGVAVAYDDTAGTITISATSTQAAISGLISGGQVVWETGYQFRVSAAEYAIDGVVYTSVEQTVTLAAADGTHDRIDVIYLDTAGLAGDITGTAAALPTEPDIDAGTQIKLTFVQVPAASSVPASVTNTSIYLENTEWTTSTSGSGFNANSTNNPYAGTKCIEGTTVANGAYVQLQAGSPITLSGVLAMFIRSKASWANGRVLRAQWYSSGVAKGVPVTIASGYWGLDTSITAAYQQVAIPITQFVVQPDTTVNQLRITDSGGSIGFYIDNIVLQSQSGSLNQGSQTYLTQAQGDARYYQLADAASTAALQELARDTIGTALTDTGLAVVTPNDGGDTIDINVPAASASDVNTGTSTTTAVTPDALAALWEQGSDVASAGTISLGEGGYFNITGTTTITDIDFATDKAGRKVWLKFAGALTLTHNASTLILPTGANITTAAGDTACFISEGSDAIRCVSYQRASGAALTASPPPSTRAAQWMAAGNTTTITTVDANGFSATATATGVNTTTANKFGSFRRMVYVTSSPASNNVAGWRAPQAMWWLGNAPGLGGFRYTCRWGNHSGGTVATNRAYVGFSESISAPTDVEPSSQTNIIGMGWDAADSNVQVMHNDGSGTATKIDLGASFAVPASDSSAMYELELYAEPNASSVAYTVTDLIGGSVATGTLTTDLPSSTTLMAHRGWMSVGGTSSNIGISFCSCSIETEF